MNRLFKQALSSTLLILPIMIGCGGGGTTTNTSTTTLSSQNVGTKPSSKPVESLSYNSDGKITTLTASSAVKSVASSQEALFFAEGEDGVEIIKIGYNDKISTELLFKISDITANHVTLSDDEKQLYVEDEKGFIQIIDISDLSHPKHVGRTTKQEIDNAAISKNGTYKYIPRGKNGLDVINISNPSNLIKESTYTISNAFDVVLTDTDTKALIATGPVGINLLDLSDPRHLTTIANYRIPNTSVTGLSLSQDNTILFVATGTKGVMVFNLDILLHKLGY